MIKIVFPEFSNEYIREVTRDAQNYQPIFPENAEDALASACEMLASGAVDTMVAGIDYSSRDVILTVRDKVGMPEGKKLFSSLFFCEFPNGRHIILSDGATCKNPDAEQLAEIVRLTHAAATKLLDEEPRIAMLSFSTFGSGGHDPSMDKIQEAIKIIRETNPEIKVDGEMQLDAAVNPRIGEKKSPHPSEVAGHANVLITPDINSGTILYKAIEQFAQAHVAGPILLGFNKPVSDLSRGSTVEDVKLTISCMQKLAS